VTLLILKSLKIVNFLVNQRVKQASCHKQAVVWHSNSNFNCVRRRAIGQNVISNGIKEVEVFLQSYSQTIVGGHTRSLIASAIGLHINSFPIFLSECYRTLIFQFWILMLAILYFASVVGLAVPRSSKCAQIKYLVYFPGSAGA